MNHADESRKISGRCLSLETPMTISNLRLISRSSQIVLVMDANVLNCSLTQRRVKSRFHWALRGCEDANGRS